VISNSANVGGGGYGHEVFAGASLILSNCTVTGNFATNYGGAVSGYAYEFNCILYYNTAPSGANYGVSQNCCSPEAALASGNITNEPAFVDLVRGDFRLQTNSPCINAGNNARVTNSADLDGRPRIVGGTVDIGAYEFQTPVSVMPYAWLQRYGLPINTATDYADPDGDGMNNWQEWRADTVPNNASSALRMLPPTGNGPFILVSWQSVSTRKYWVERASDLAAQPAFSTIATNLPGQAGIKTYTDNTAFGSGPFIYRVGVVP
jgi:hypothetical protein